MIRIPDPGRFELRLMDGSANPYLLQASVLAAGLYGLKNKTDPGKPLNCNMYEDHEKYPDLPKLPNELSQSLEKLKNNKDMNEAFGKEAINSYIKLRNSELKEFKQKENFDKTKPITRWERDNTLDCQNMTILSNGHLWKHSEFIENSNFIFDKNKILNSLTKKDIDDAYLSISSWKG